jgi:hypothetical protein
MDIFAHTLWTNAVARGANVVAEKENKKFHVHVGWTAFFGVFPDLFAFTIPFVIRFYNSIIGQSSFFNFFSHPHIEGGNISGTDFNLAHNLYQYSHSLVVWAIVFCIVWAFYRRPRYELFGWALHILIDIPSHALSFYPTPFLFPVSSYHFPYGIQWSSYWYMVINYGALLMVWGSIFLKGLLPQKANKI